MRRLLGKYRHVLGYAALATLFFVYHVHHRKQCEMHENISDYQVLTALSDNFENKSEEYRHLFGVCANLVESLNWDTIGYYTNHQSMPDTLNPKIEIYYLQESFERTGMNIDSDKIHLTVSDSTVDGPILEMFGINQQQIQKLNVALHQTNHNFVSVYRDGTVVIPHHVGSNLMNGVRYEFIKPGPTVFYYGNYARVDGILIGKK